MTVPAAASNNDCVSETSPVANQDSLVVLSEHSKSMVSVVSGTGQVFSEVALYKGVIVSIKHIRKEHIQVTPKVMMEIKEVLQSSFCSMMMTMVLLVVLMIMMILMVVV